MGGGKIKRGEIPRGLEVLVKKASVDSEFNDILLKKRSGASLFIGLNLTDVESAMLDGIPEEQLVTIISNTRVIDKQRPAFMGYAAAAMLAAVGFVAGCGGDSEEYEHEYEVTGIDPSLEYLDEAPEGDEVEGSDEGESDESTEETDKYEDFGTGIRPDLPYIDEGDEGESEEETPEGEE